MKLSEVVLEAPEFGDGRLAEDRPINLAQLSDKISSDIVTQDELLGSFSTRLRTDMLEIAMTSGKERLQYVEDLKCVAEDMCACDLVVKTSEFISNPDDAGKLANLTHSMITTTVFLASISRV